MRAAVYIRWSTDDQAEGTTLEVQREACRHFILSQGWSLDEDLVFIDDGYSGASLARPGLDALRRLCREGAVECVVVYKLDRLSRSVLDTVKLVMEEWQGRVALKSAREAIDTATPMGRQVFYLLVSYAEWERNVIRERTASGKWRRAREGRNPGAVAPYGYRHAGIGRIAPDPAEAPVVRRIFAEAAAQRSARQIATGLNADQISSRHDRGWSAATVARLLRNPVYAGTLAYGRTAPNPRAGAGPRRIRQAPAVAVADALPALVPAGEFDRVQALLSARRPGQMAPRSAAGGGLLSGIAVCGRCGSGLTSHRRRGGSYRYYRCSAAAAKGAAWCDGGFIPQALAEEAVLGRLHELYQPPAPDPGAHISREQQRVAAAIRETRARLREAGASQARLQQAFLRGRIDVDRLERLAALQEGEQRRLQVELRRLEAERAAYCRGGRGQAAPRLTSAEQKTVLRTLLAGARLYRPRTGTTVTLDLVWRTETLVLLPD